MKLIAIAWMLLSAGAVAADPVDGEVVRSQIQVGRATVPLPGGEWKVVAEHTGTTTVDGTLTGPRWRGVYMVQVDAQNRFAGSMYVRATTSPATNVSSWSDSTCNRTDTLFRDTLGATFTKPNCLLINHLASYQKAVPSQAFDRHVWDWLQREKVLLPRTALQIQTRLYRFGDFLLVNYTVNPELAGLDPGVESSWASSEWHPGKIKDDPKRLAFLEKVIAYARQAAAADEAALEGTVRAELPPLPQ